MQAENVYTLGSINRELSERAYLEIKKHIPKIIKEYIPVIEKKKRAGSPMILRCMRANH